MSKRVVSYVEDADSFALYVDSKKIAEWDLDSPTHVEVINVLVDALDVEFEEINTLYKAFPESF